MAEAGAQDRNLPASARKLAKARQEGNVPRSRDLSHVAAIAVGGAALAMAAPTMTSALHDLLAGALRFDRGLVASPAAMGERLAQATWVFLAFALPMGLLMMVVGLAGALLSGGWVWTTKPLGPAFSKLNPLSGLGRIVSKQQLIATLKACALALLLGTIGGAYLATHLDAFGGALALSLPAAVSHVSSLILTGCGLMVLMLAAFAIVDVPLQRHLYLGQLKMSHQEAKQEHKEVEGSGEVKAKIRARMREVARRRMMAAVPEADLVVMNPTHYAVALKYDDLSMAAPRVVAKGADLIAMRIRDLAKEHKVPVLQAPVLARALYAHAELDREIPAALFAAVAQVLAYVYQLRAAMGGRGAMPGELPELNVPAELDPHHGRAAAAANGDDGEAGDDLGDAGTDDGARREAAR